MHAVNELRLIANDGERAEGWFEQIEPAAHGAGDFGDEEITLVYRTPARGPDVAPEARSDPGAAVSERRALIGSIIVAAVAIVQVLAVAFAGRL